MEMRIRSAWSICVAASVLLVAAESSAQDTDFLLRQLSDDSKAEDAVQALADRGPSVVPRLQTLAISSSDNAARGWAVVSIGRIPGKQAESALLAIQDDGALPMLVRTWAAAARVQRAGSSEELTALLPLQRTFVALDRPFKKKFSSMLSDGAGMSVHEMLRLAQRMPQLRQMIVEPVLARGAGQLVDAMVRTPDDVVRRNAAAYLATLAQRSGPEDIANVVVAAYRFTPEAEDAPWAGGALFVPGIQWPKKQATQLVTSLIAWLVWSDVKGHANYQKQIHNNIRSLSLARVVGYSSPGWNGSTTEQWLQIWSKTFGSQSATSILQRVGVDRASKYYEAIR